MKTKKYSCIFFDLDRTLWDFDTNTSEALHDIIDKYCLLPAVMSLEKFAEAYKMHNEILWHEYREGRLHKEVLLWKRFRLTLEHFGIFDLKLSKKIGVDFLGLSQMKNKLLPYTHEVLAYLKKKYPLYIITNGFEEVQFTKIENCDLSQYFNKVITSEAAGVQKPDPAIFEHALQEANADPSESLMIGDDLEVDIKGARNAGIDQVYVNSDKKSHNEIVTFEIHSLLELKRIL
ncbi:MAG: YjjG family noncanonical pyrimidine nucleotidase [Bacteroidia bacterium]|nr:YjjG family noncanonical pyrimidine nucleotidase [Bacteroidia bacterium]